MFGTFAEVDFDEDGVWDSQDDCLDATACRLGSSPTEPCSYLDALVRVSEVHVKEMVMEMGFVMM